MILAVTAAASRLSAVGLIALVALVIFACSGEEEAPAPEEPAAEQRPSNVAPPPPPPEPVEEVEQPEPAPARTPADPAALLVSEAAALERNGYWEQALAVRASAIAAGGSLDAAALTALQLDQVRLLLRLERPLDAQAALSELGGGLSGGHMRRQALLRARSALMLEQWDAAVEAMTDYVNSDSPAWAQISLEIARTLQRAGRGSEAIAWAERALGGNLPFQDRLRALHLAATELDIAGEIDRALTHYDELLRQSPWRDDQAAALSRIGILQRGAGNLEAAQDAWMRLINDYRGFAESSEALAFLLDSGVDVSELTIGLIRFEEERWVEARTAMLNVLGGSSVLAEQVAGEFYIAAIHEANGDRQSASLGYAAVIGRDRSDPLAAEASMRLAEFAAADGDQLAAEEQWRRVMEEQPAHWRAPQAARRWASLAASRGQWAEAGRRYSEAARLAADHWERGAQQEFLYWSALAHREAGDLATSNELALAIVDLDPVSYYGLRASELAQLEPPGLLEIPLEEWLMRLTGESAGSGADVEQISEWQAARDLRLGGFDAAADRALSSLIDRLSGDPWQLAAAAQALSAADEVASAARAALRVMTHFGLNWLETPPELLRLVYPQPWRDVMLRHAMTEAIDPLLLWSLIRRESFYDADARGLAGEVGLTQVIPLTGSDIAAGLGIEYQHDDLARPELSIRFGAWYLARQLAGFSNEPIMALAAYNAGPGNAARWEAAALLAGPDGFLQALDFNSTRMYVQYVIEAWAAYLALERAEPGG